MDLIEFMRDLTKFRRLTQYDVNLNILSNRRARRTEIPKLPGKNCYLLRTSGITLNVPPLTSAQTTSKALPTMTIQSNRLNFEAK